MAKKKNQDDNNGKEDSGGKKQMDSGVTVVVLKIDLHCEGCAGRVVKTVRTFDGVESVRIGDSELNKLTVIGNIDPVTLRQKVEEKTKKKVEIISPATKKNDGDNTTKSGSGGDNKKKQQKPQQDQQPPTDKPKTAVKKDEKKSKEIPVTTAVLKVPLHCQGCIRTIHKIVSKTKGYMEMSIDKSKDLVTVKGAMDMKLLAEALHHKLKRVVEVVPAKKDSGEVEKKAKGGGEKKAKGGGSNDGDGKGGGSKGKEGGLDDVEGNNGGGKAEAYKMENYGGPIGYPYPYPQYPYGSGYADYVHAPQLFSDENPNACILM